MKISDVVAGNYDNIIKETIRRKLKDDDDDNQNARKKKPKKKA